MIEELLPAIRILEEDLAEFQRRVAETKIFINWLCERAGESPRYLDTDVPQPGGTMSIRSDQYYGQRMSKAAREYLAMRKAANLGPAKPREVYEALREGGYAFDTKDDANAIVSVRSTLRKNSSTFHRLPNGEYGLLSWYPNAKKAKPAEDVDDINDDDAQVNMDHPDEGETADDEESPAAP